EPVQVRDRVAPELDAVGVAALDELDEGPHAQCAGQYQADAEAVEAGPRAGRQQRLDVVEVVGVAGVGELDLARVDTLVNEEPHLLEDGLRGRARGGPRGA